MLRLAGDVTYLVARALVDAALQLLGVAVGLFYWSVRTYGWGRVLSFLVALWFAVALRDGVSQWSASRAGLVTLVASTLCLWGAMLFGSALARQMWRRWMESLESGVPRLSGGRSFRFGLAMEQGRRKGRRITIAVHGSDSLWARLLDRDVLARAWQRVFARGGGPGPDGVTVEAFALNAAENLEQIASDLQSGRYRPQPPRWVPVPKRSGGTRRLAVLCVRDRIVQQAILSILAPLWDSAFAPCSFAYRPGRSALQAVAEVERSLASGRVWIVDADVESFFDSVPHGPLFLELRKWLADVRLRELMRLCVSATSPERERGLAQGAPLSPLLANLYLHRFDLVLTGAGHRLIRYADDFLVMCATRGQAEDALRTAERALRALGLRLNRLKTRIVHRDEGFTFLGYTFTREGKRPSEEAVRSLRERLAAAEDETARRQVLAGWMGYFGDGLGVPAGLDTGTGRPGVEVGAEVDDVPWWADLDGDTDGHPDREALALFRQRFVGRRDVFARYWRSGDRDGYVPVREELTDERLNAHLCGEDVLATYLLESDGTTKALVLDIDGPDGREEGKALALEVARKLESGLRAHGIAPLWVDTGGKGYHLWLCFPGRVSAREVRAWAARWLDGFRPFPEGVVVEVFPKQDGVRPGGLGSPIRLPFGHHPETHRRSTLLGPDGKPVEDVWRAVETSPPVEPEKLLRVGAGHRAAPEDPPAAVAPVVTGCSYLRALVGKAGATAHLRHTERLVLLYTLGHLGEEGRNYLHQVISLCTNYNPRVTQRWIDRLEEGHKPLRCATVREWLKDYLPGTTCGCARAGRVDSPIDLLKGEDGPRCAVGDPPVGDWKEVAAEIFGEMLAEDAPGPHPDGG
jgi:group II intron reverse transcriptase/maturase